MIDVDRLFLDANILFSASYKEGSSLVQLWELKTAILFTSTYALEEARFNTISAEQRLRLEKLVKTIRVIPFQPEIVLPDHCHLPAKDIPILQAAIAVRATHLLTGDLNHFGHLYHQTIHGVTVLPPHQYFERRKQE